MKLPNFLEDELFTSLLQQMRIEHNQNLASLEQSLFHAETRVEVPEISTILPSSYSPDNKEFSQGLLETVTTIFRPKEKKPSLQLDIGKINEISKATEELFEVVTRAINEEVETEIGIDSHLHLTIPEHLKTLFSDFIEHLDNRYYGILAQLLGQCLWTREAFELLSRKHHLMPSAVIEVINEWSDEYLGDYLLETEESAYMVNIDLIPSAKSI